MTSKFCRDILSGKKSLLKLSQVLWVEEVPNWSEFTSKNVWQRAKSNSSILRYFPDYSDS